MGVSVFRLLSGPSSVSVQVARYVAFASVPHQAMFVSDWYRILTSLPKWNQVIRRSDVRLGGIVDNRSMSQGF
jgi:hypothetical protein